MLGDIALLGGGARILLSAVRRGQKRGSDTGGAARPAPSRELACTLPAGTGPPADLELRPRRLYRGGTHPCGVSPVLVGSRKVGRSVGRRCDAMAAAASRFAAGSRREVALSHT